MGRSSLFAPLMVWILAQFVGGWPSALHAEEADPRGHLFFVKRMEHKHTLELISTSPYYEVVEMNEYRKKNKHLVKIGETFGFGDRFRVKQFDRKTVHDPDYNTDKDVSRLLVHDNVMHKDINLVLNAPFDLFDPAVFFEWHSKTTEGIKVGIGETFRIPGQEDTTYKVLEVHDDSAIIARVLPDGTHDKEIVIPRQSASEKSLPK